MAELSERHEVRLRGNDKTITFIADSDDGRLVIRQEDDDKKAKDVCSITLSDPDELRGFFKGLRRMMASLGVSVESGGSLPPKPKAIPAPKRDVVAPRRDDTTPEREAIIAEARQRNAQAFAPWTEEEEQDVRRLYEAGKTIEAIARMQKRSPRAIELRLQRLGLLPHS
jgi:hypothetical protein